MATFTHQHGRKKIHFTDHALDRWWERCKENDIHGRQQAMNLLRERLAQAKWTSIPSWARLSLWNQARAEGFLAIDPDAGFVVNQNPNRDRVAVTYIENFETNPDSFRLAGRAA